MAACRTHVAFLLLSPFIVVSAGDVAKQVVHTPWWPPGSEDTAESVGIISHGFEFMTAMMEVNFTASGSFDLNATMVQMLSDVRDIARAAELDLVHLVDCLINAPKGYSGVARAAFTAVLPEGVRPALTFLEMPGEYAMTPFSVTCIAALGPQLPKRVRHGSTSGMLANGMLYVEGTTAEGANATQETLGALASIGKLVSTAGGQGLERLLDCTVYVQHISDAAPVRNALGAMKSNVPAITLVEAGLEDKQRAVSLRCVAAVGKDLEVQRFPEATAAGGLVFVSGQFDTSTKGLGAFQKLKKAMDPAGVGLSDVVNCFFYTKDQAKNFDLFDGFYQVFNKNHPPPPTRGELQGNSECSECAVLAKCIASKPLGGAVLV